MNLSDAQQDLASLNNTLNGLENHTNGLVDGLNENVSDLQNIQYVLDQLDTRSHSFGMG